mmetsp:Transcript_3402/g.4899  ORF Transcript_3402/g.4899 Transcript_3402/m.4899 type:complete len:87 (-) Transcript_3402:442-702(-)
MNRAGAERQRSHKPSYSSDEELPPSWCWENPSDRPRQLSAKKVSMVQPSVAEGIRSVKGNSSSKNPTVAMLLEPNNIISAIPWMGA